MLYPTSTIRRPRRIENLFLGTDFVGMTVDGSSAIGGRSVWQIFAWDTMGLLGSGN